MLKTIDSVVVLVNDYGMFHFKNMQKLYKFQVMCPHPESLVRAVADFTETTCLRCEAVIDRFPINITPDSWADDGGV